MLYLLDLHIRQVQLAFAAVWLRLQYLEAVHSFFLVFIFQIGGHNYIHLWYANSYSYYKTSYVDYQVYHKL